MVTDVDGNRFLDFAAGIAVTSTGHAHPSVVAAIKEQADRLIHIAATDFYEPRYLEFMERLASHRPVRRAGARLPHQLGHRGGGGRDQAGALPHPSARDHRLRGRVPWSNPGRAVADQLEDQAARRLRPAAADGPPHAVPADPRLARGVRGRRQRGAGLPALSILGRIIAPTDVAAIVIEPVPGRGRLLPGPGHLPGRPARAVRRARHPADRRRDPVGDGTHRPLVGDGACRRRAGHRDQRQGHRLGDADRRHHRPRVGLDLASPAHTAQPSPATRSARRQGWPRWTCSGRPDRQLGCDWRRASGAAGGHRGSPSPACATFAASGS